MNKFFESNGFQVIPVKYLIEELIDFKKNIFEVFNALGISCGFGSVDSESSLIKFRLQEQGIQYRGVKLLYQSPYLYRIGANQILMNDVCAKFGLKQLVHDIQPQFRVDMPIDEQSLFRAHQDYAYNNGSNNSITIWLPLQDTDIKQGALEVVPGSHRLGVLPNNKGELIDGDFEYTPCKVKFGEALVFDQKLVHRSGFNTSEIIRFSIQIRLSDILDPHYIERGWPQNHQTKVLGYATPI